MASNTKTKLNTGEITHQNTKKKTFLFLLGTQKAGSTWLNNQLKQSDEFWGSELKEWRLWRQYFKLNKSINFQIDKDSKAPIEDFFHSNSIKAHLTKKERNQIKRQKIRRNPKEFLENCVAHINTHKKLKILADFTPSLGMLEVQQLKEISEMFFKSGIETKSIFLIRDPLQRALSQAQMKINNKHKEIAHDRKAVNKWILSNKKALLKRSRVDETLAKITLIEKFIQTKIIFFDELFNQNSLDSICQYLDISPISVDLINPNKSKPLEVDSQTKAILAKDLESTYIYLNHHFKGRPKKMWAESFDYIEMADTLKRDAQLTKFSNKKN